MIRRIRAVFRDGTFVPEERVSLPEGTPADVVVGGPALASPPVTDPDKRKKVLDRLLNRMDRNPLPVPANSLTRERLHERG
jgi:predicted DNA-binding antitoxin AbrB/MazE fold protein